ncbi:UNKNOWN [Stylonychia lemnae]|uniref:Uncharacterized protein n=1 Tax=Stylonychia lemnae TaxID=5949 RepID=A0A077ZVD0_STYLE|nr:UNKNOWN [Stylonychia lemnae]|eukprot:CDW73809.1 UNKNOWN [Stylonychia lemnae]
MTNKSSEVSRIRREIGQSHFTLGQSPPCYTTTLKASYVPVFQRYDSQLRKDRLNENMKTNFNTNQDSLVKPSDYRKNDYAYRPIPSQQKLLNQTEILALRNTLKRQNFEIGDRLGPNYVDKSSNHDYGLTAYVNVRHLQPGISNTFKTTFELGNDIDAMAQFQKRSKSVSRNQSDFAQNLLNAKQSFDERLRNQEKISQAYIKIGSEADRAADMLQSESQLKYSDHYNASRNINIYDNSYVKFIKQHNWEYRDAAVAPPNEKPSPMKSEIKDSYNYKGQGAINRLSPERIKDFKSVHFEIGNQKMGMLLSSSTKDAFVRPNVDNRNIQNGSVAWQQKNKFLLLGPTNHGSYQTNNNDTYQWKSTSNSVIKPK